MENMIFLYSKFISCTVKMYFYILGISLKLKFVFADMDTTGKYKITQLKSMLDKERQTRKCIARHFHTFLTKADIARFFSHISHQESNWHLMWWYYHCKEGTGFFKWLLKWDRWKCVWRTIAKKQKLNQCTLMFYLSCFSTTIRIEFLLMIQQF